MSRVTRQWSTIIIRDSMTNCRLFLLSLVVLLMTVVGVGCTTEVDYNMGEEFVPTNKNMELRRRVYALGQRVEQGDSVDCPLVTTRLYRTDSLKSANLKKGFFGREISSTYGERTACFMSQMIFSLSLPKERGWGYRPIFDSMVLSLCVSDYQAEDTTKSHRFEVYEITSNDYLTAVEDTTFYINFDPTPYISEKPIFTFLYPNQEKGVYIGDMENPTNREVKLEETDYTMEYISRLMFLENVEANGGYALDNDSLYVSGYEREFVDKVRGLCIKPADDMEGAMFVTDLENTALLLYSRGRYEEDPTIIRDTTYMIYNLYLNPASYDINAGNVSVNSVKYDLAASTVGNVSNEEQLTTTYVEGLGGTVTEVMFTDEFIQSLADIVLEADGDAVVSVNQAMMSIYLEGSNYDYNFADPLGMATILDGALGRVGLYTDYNRMVTINDYAYSVESANAPLDYDGYLSRSLACYKVNISNYIQSLINLAVKNVDESGKVNLEKFSADYQPAEESLVTSRRFYIAPEVYSLYSFKRQAICGMYAGDDTVAPIKLELTYTIVN